jgi:hypothetical protein
MFILPYFLLFRQSPAPPQGLAWEGAAGATGGAGARLPVWRSRARSDNLLKNVAAAQPVAPAACRAATNITRCKMES